MFTLKESDRNINCINLTNCKRSKMFIEHSKLTSRDFSITLVAKMIQMFYIIFSDIGYFKNSWEIVRKFVNIN